jgi:micrococcal nuclease
MSLSPSKRVGWALAAAVMLLLASGCEPVFEEQGGEKPAASDERRRTLDGIAGVDRQALPEGLDEAEVADNVDGDTIEVVFPPDDRQVDVRLVGINAPESVRPNSPVECYGPESSERLAELLPPGTPVYLEQDVSDTDRFGRLLRHVWVVDDASGNACLVSEILVREGYVDARPYQPDDRYDDRLAAAERTAQDDGVGLWGVCEG